MKSIAIFLLVGLSLFQNGNCDFEEEGSVPPIADCVISAAKSSPALLKKLRDILCMYAEGQSTKNAETLNKVVTAVKEFLKKSCTKEEISSLGISSDEPVDGVAQSADDVLDALQPTLDTISLTKPVTNAMCQIINAITHSHCLKNAITNSPDFSKSIISQLKKFKCKKFTVGGLKQCFSHPGLTKASCEKLKVLQNLDLVDQEISKYVENLLKETVIGKVLGVLDKPKVTKLVNAQLCGKKKVVHNLHKAKV